MLVVYALPKFRSAKLITVIKKKKDQASSSPDGINCSDSLNLIILTVGEMRWVDLNAVVA